MDNIKDTVLRLSQKLNYYSESRMPYTYHHDQMRKEHPELYESRADVAAAFRWAEDDHLYSVAFYHLLASNDGVDVVNYLTPEELQEAYRIVRFAEAEMVNSQK